MVHTIEIRSISYQHIGILYHNYLMICFQLSIRLVTVYLFYLRLVLMLSLQKMPMFQTLLE